MHYISAVPAFQRHCPESFPLSTQFPDSVVAEPLEAHYALPSRGLSAKTATLRSGLFRLLIGRTQPILPVTQLAGHPAAFLGLWMTSRSDPL